MTIRTTTAFAVVEALLAHRATAGRRGTGVGIDLPAGLLSSAANAPSWGMVSPAPFIDQVRTKLTSYLLRVGSFPVVMLPEQFQTGLSARPYGVARVLANAAATTSQGDNVVIADDGLVHIIAHETVVGVTEYVKHLVMRVLGDAWHASKVVHDQLPGIAEYQKRHWHPLPFHETEYQAWFKAMSTYPVTWFNLTVCALLHYLDVGKLEIVEDDATYNDIYVNGNRGDTLLLLASGICSCDYEIQYAGTEDETCERQVTRKSVRWVDTGEIVDVTSFEFGLAWLESVIQEQGFADSVLDQAVAAPSDITDAVDDALDSVVLACGLVLSAYTVPRFADQLQRLEQRMLAGGQAFCR